MSDTQNVPEDQTDHPTHSEPYESEPYESDMTEYDDHPAPARTRGGRRPVPPRRRSPRHDDTPAAKSPLLAAFLGLVPGLGNIYNGLYARGFVFFLLVVSLFYTAIESGEGPHLALLIPSLIFVWLFNIFDGYRQATLINWGWDEESEATAAQRGSGSLAAGIALFLIGLYGLLHQIFDIDLSALLEYWYVIIMAVGGWLIYQARANAAEESAA